MKQNTIFTTEAQRYREIAKEFNEDGRIDKL